MMIPAFLLQKIIQQAQKHLRENEDLPRLLIDAASHPELLAKLMDQWRNADLVAMQCFLYSIRNCSTCDSI